MAHNVARADHVDAILELARGAGSPDVAPAQQRDWGGYTGYFADPDGNKWAVQEIVIPDLSGSNS